MTTKFYALLTNQGAAKFANAAALGTKVQITEMAVGDGGGTLPTPDALQTKLIGEKRRAALNSLSVDAVNSSQIIAEQVIPENEGGFWIREIGLFDADGDLVAVANCAETYKPQLQEGSGRTQTVRMILIVNSTAAVTLKIDPSVVLATRKYVDDKAIEVRAYVGDVMKKHLAEKNPHSQYLQTASALAEIRDAGLAADALKNLGLGDMESRYQSGFFPFYPVNLPADTDLNTILSPGVYYQRAIALTSLELNYPLVTAGTLVVYRNMANKDNGCVQEYRTYGDSTIFTRAYLSSTDTWTSWQKVPNMSDFSSALSASGCQKLPSGLIMQWGNIGISSGDVRTTFPIAFPNACLRAFAMQSYTPGSGSVGYIASGGWTSTYMISRCNSAALGAQFLAIGY